MSDIVERLRHYAAAWEAAGVSKDQLTATHDILEAADEIERLRLQLRQNDQKLDEILERIKKLGI